MSERFSYDELPYPSKFFLQTHPDRLATVATMFGMSPAAVETCRVLELGCGNGSNLISHAFHLPNAEFLGVDLAQNHIDDAESGVANLNLTNIRFRQMDVAEMTVDEFGKFDYIIAHGLFSWVPEFVRDRVLSLCAEMLAENGVGYISYNAFPGAHYRRMVQSMLRFHTRTKSEPIGKVGSAMSFLAFLAENSAGGEIYRSILQTELERHFEHDAADIYHDDLSDQNRAYYFYEFDSMLRQNGLKYLGEAELHAMGTGGLSAEAREFAASIDDIHEREQYLDMIRGRIFRQTLFCRSEINLDHKPEATVIGKFSFASSVKPASPKPDLASSRIERFVGSKGVSIRIDHPLTKAALVELGNEWGGAIQFDELAGRARVGLEALGYKSPDWAAETATLGALLLQLCLETSAFEVHLFQPRSSQSVPARPRVNALARWQLPQAENVLTMLNLDVRIEDAVSRRLLELLDGTRDSAESLAELRLFVETSDAVEDPAELLSRLGEWHAQSIAQLARLGMFDSE